MGMNMQARLLKPINQFLINSGIYIISKDAVNLIRNNDAPFDMPYIINF